MSDEQTSVEETTTGEAKPMSPIGDILAQATAGTTAPVVPNIPTLETSVESRQMRDQKPMFKAGQLVQDDPADPWVAYAEEVNGSWTTRYRRTSDIPADVQKEDDEYYEKPGGVLFVNPNWEPALHPTFANPTNLTLEYQYGYRPVRENPPDASFQLRAVPGIEGKVYCKGDLVLMVCPKAAYEARENARQEYIEREKAAMVAKPMDAVRDFAENHGLHFRGDINDLRDADGNRVSGGNGNVELPGGSEDSYDPAAESVGAELARAMENAQAMKAKSVFGGFQGSPQYNRVQTSADRARGTVGR